MDPNVKLTSDQCPKMTDDFATVKNVPYYEAVGLLMYALLGTHPNITYAVQAISHFSHNPGLAYWEAVKHIFCYLKGTSSLWLSYGGEQKELIGYIDVDGSMTKDCHALSGYTILIHGSAISWTTKWQEMISLSMTESKYIAITHGTKQALWLCSLISQLFNTPLNPTTIFSDNQSAIALASDHKFHACTKHIDIHYHFIHWIVENGSICLVYCPTDEMVANALTKALPLPKVKHFMHQLGLVLV